MSHEAADIITRSQVGTKHGPSINCKGILQEVPFIRMLRATLRLGLILLSEYYSIMVFNTLQSVTVIGLYGTILNNVVYFAVLNQLLPPSAALRSSGKNYNKPSSSKTLAGTSSGLPAQNTTRRGLGISAWGIVILVVSIIVGIMALYYFSVCYPICQGYSSSNRYDKMPKMGLPTMAWAWDAGISWTYLMSSSKI